MPCICSIYHSTRLTMGYLGILKTDAYHACFARHTFFLGLFLPPDLLKYPFKCNSLANICIPCTCSIHHSTRLDLGYLLISNTYTENANTSSYLGVLQWLDEKLVHHNGHLGQLFFFAFFFLKIMIGKVVSWCVGMALVVPSLTKGVQGHRRQEFFFFFFFIFFSRCIVY